MTTKENNNLKWMASLFDEALSAGRLTFALMRDWLNYQRKQRDAGNVSAALFTAYESLVEEYEAVLS